jgi:C-terminal processing protease CtpA/Prc
MTNIKPPIDTRRDVLSTLLATYEKRVYDVAFRDALRPLMEADMPQLLDAPNFDSEVDERLRRIGIFPTVFEHEENRRIELRRLISATFHQVASPEPTWVFQDVHGHGLAASNGVKSGDDLLAINDAPVRPPLKPAVPASVVSQLAFQNGNGKKTLNIDPSKFGARPANPLTHWLLHRDPQSYVQALVLPGDIGYVRVAEFPGLIGVDMARQIDGAFNRVRRCTRLIVDIRGNPGGGTANLRLMTHLTPERIPVGHSLTRPRTETGYRREDFPQFTRIPRSRLMLPFAVWKYRKLDKSIVVVTEGRKLRPYDGRIVMLVNEHTTSGAEIVAGFAADHQLATLVGTRTRGRLLGFSRFPVGHGYFLTIPVSNYVTWEGKTFEGTGVAPQVDAPFDPILAKAGRDCQLERAVALLP